MKIKKWLCIENLVCSCGKKLDRHYKMGLHKILGCLPEEWDESIVQYYAQSCCCKFWNEPGQMLFAFMDDYNL